jgi:hypothetical protein
VGAAPPWHLCVSFVDDITVGQFKPQRKSAREMVFGIIGGGSCQLSKVGEAASRVIGSWDDEEVNTARRYNTVEKRLSRNINSDRLDDDLLLGNYGEKMAPLLMRNDGEGVVVALDESDITKNYADDRPGRGMEYIAAKRDGNATVPRFGSAGRKKPGKDNPHAEVTKGYMIAQVEASMPNGNSFPLVYNVFSRVDPDYLSDFDECRRSVLAAAPYVGSKAIWVGDAGSIYDNRRFFDFMDGLSLTWCVRIKAGKNSRTMQNRDLRKGPRTVEQIIREVRSELTREVQVGKELMKLSFGYAQVRDCPGGTAAGPWRGLLVVRGFARPVAYLVSRKFKNINDAMTFHAAYRRRWPVEEMNRAAKDSHGWGPEIEDVRALTLRGVRRIVNYAMIGYGFMAWMREQAKATAEKLIKSAWVMEKRTKDMSYRLFHALSRFFMHAPAAVKSRLRRLDAWATGPPEPG